MTWVQTKYNGNIRAGETTLDHSCGECGNEAEIPFKYFLKYQKFIHHGQCVEGDVEEWLRIETTLPEQVQCSECDAVYEVEEPAPLMGEYNNPRGLTLYGETMAMQSFGSRGDIDSRLEEGVKSISLKLTSTPRRV